MNYWDTSALLKLYVPERDSAFFLNLVASRGQPVFSSAIASTEVLSALFRKEHAGDLKPGGARALFKRFSADCGAGRIVLLPYGSDVIAEAEKLIRIAFELDPPVMVRSLDLIHVASAVAGKATSLVATDQRLRALASLVTLKLVP